MSHIFVSYKREDQPRAKQIAAALERMERRESTGRTPGSA